MRKVIALLAATAAIAAFGANAHAAAPKTSWTDATGDAGLGHTPGTLPAIGEGGFDITKGSIVKKGANLEFKVEHATMPPIGTLPEAFRFLWHFNVNNAEYRFMAKSADVGKPDAIANSGQDRVGKVDSDGHFRLEQCVNEPAPAGPLELVNCRPVAYLDGKFDAATKSFTVIVLFKAIKAKTGSKITAGTSGNSATGCVVCWLNHTAERSNTGGANGGGIIDAAIILTSYKVPKK